MNTNQKKERYYKIIDGPNKDTLFDSCKYAFVKEAVIPISFDIVEGYTMPKGHPGRAYALMSTTNIRITGIDNEDGSGESFLLRGDLKKRGDKYNFEAFYNSKIRQGSIRLFK